jgi:hypothetical protein
MSDDLKEMATILIDRIKEEIEEANIDKLINLLPLFKEIRSTITMAHRLQLTAEDAGRGISIDEEFSLEDLENEINKLGFADLEEGEEEEGEDFEDEGEDEDEDEEIEEELEEGEEEEAEQKPEEKVAGGDKTHQKLLKEFLLEWERKKGGL